jgi:hypothetical protein
LKYSPKTPEFLVLKIIYKYREKNMTEQTYETVIKNERTKVGVVVWDHRGSGMMVLGPGQTETIETWNPETLFAPFSSVTYKEDGTISTTPNPAYPAPKSKWLLTIINLDGRDPQRRIIGGREVCLPKGLARIFEIEVDDPMAVYSRMEIKVVRVCTPSPMFPDYNEFFDEVKDIYFDRSEDELKLLAAELEKLATDVEEVEHA